MPIVKMLDASTGHLSKRDRELMDLGLRDLPRIQAHEHGWIVFISSDPEAVEEHDQALEGAKASKGLRKLCEIAAKKGCYLINFDADGRPHKNVTVYE